MLEALALNGSTSLESAFVLLLKLAVPSVDAVRGRVQTSVRGEHANPPRGQLEERRLQGVAEGERLERAEDLISTISVWAYGRVV